VVTNVHNDDVAAHVVRLVIHVVDYSAIYCRADVRQSLIRLADHRSLAHRSDHSQDRSGSSRVGQRWHRLNAVPSPGRMRLSHVKQDNSSFVAHPSGRQVAARSGTRPNAVRSAAIRITARGAWTCQCRRPSGNSRFGGRHVRPSAHHNDRSSGHDGHFWRYSRSGVGASASTNALRLGRVRPLTCDNDAFRQPV
jgi:hypothetical protein